MVTKTVKEIKLVKVVKASKVVRISERKRLPMDDALGAYETETRKN